MQKYIAKFEAFGSSDLQNLFKDNNLKSSDIDNMIDRLDKYNLDRVLSNELRRSKERGYRDMRKWKIDSILSRYNNANKIIETAETIEDYLLELTDNGYRIKVYPTDINSAMLLIYTKGVRKSRLDRVAEVTSFLQHLNNSHRLNVELESIRDSNEFKVFVAHRTETEHERTLRNLRRMINPQNFDYDEEEGEE